MYGCTVSGSKITGIWGRSHQPRRQTGDRGQSPRCWGYF